jgi:hypothetical protein
MERSVRMTIKLNCEDLFSTDIKLHDLLQEVKIDNPVLINFFISFPSESQIKNRQYGIFIGHAKNVLKEQTSHGDKYTAQIIVLITSKQTDYKLAKVGIDLGTQELIKTIKTSELAKKNFRWTESNIEYTDQLDIKYRSITFLFDEMYIWDDADYDEQDLQLIFEDVKLTIKKEG